MLEVNNLSVTARSGAQLLNQISFQIEIGEAIGLTGPSGAGKTTLLKALPGILSGGCQVRGGTIPVDGQSLWTLPPRKRRELCGTTLGFIPQNPMTAFDPRLKMGRQMEETLRLRTGVFGKEAVERVHPRHREAVRRRDRLLKLVVRAEVPNPRQVGEKGRPVGVPARLARQAVSKGEVQGLQPLRVGLGHVVAELLILSQAVAGEVAELVDYYQYRQRENQLRGLKQKCFHSVLFQSW